MYLHAFEPPTYRYQRPIAADPGDPPARPPVGQSSPTAKAGVGPPPQGQPPRGYRRQSSGASPPATPAAAEGGPPMGQQPMPSQFRPVGKPQPGGGPDGRAGTPAGVPSVDVIDGPQAVAIVVDLPGCAKEDVEIEANGHAVRIFATRDTDPAERERPTQRERPDRMERVVDLRATVVVENSEAAYENGVLRITLPKASDERRRTIGIH